MPWSERRARDRRVPEQPRPAVSGPAAGTPAAFLQLAAAVGNQRAAQIARQPFGNPWYGPAIGGEDHAHAQEVDVPPGLDLSFLDDDELEDPAYPPGLDLSFLDDDVPVTAEPVPQGELATVEELPPLPGPEQATVSPGTVPTPADVQLVKGQPPPQPAKQAPPAARRSRTSPPSSTRSRPRTRSRTSRSRSTSCSAPGSSTSPTATPMCSGAPSTRGRPGTG